MDGSRRALQLRRMVIGRTNRHAGSLRRNSTDAEDKLWQCLRDRRLGGFKFRRQATVGHYVADFLCAEKRLIVELRWRSAYTGTRRRANGETRSFRLSGDPLLEP